ncbi:hypothetical protein C0971_07815 [Bacillus methanolicus]|nr:hypothetical protein C0971_07815 [Bacillus methanolicus]
MRSGAANVGKQLVNVTSDENRDEKQPSSLQLGAFTNADRYHGNWPRINGDRTGAHKGKLPTGTEFENVRGIHVDETIGGREIKQEFYTERLKPSIG